jgi:hypothetical protein
MSPVQAVQIIPKTEDKWTCYDYSVDFAKNNPDFGIVTISDNQLFRSSTGYSHMVNYKVVSENILQIHDGLYKTDYLLAGWKTQGYYHFWLEGTPVRNYYVLQDNSKEFIRLNTQTYQI